MEWLTTGEVEIAVERTGESGPPLVLVHGSWSNHFDWGRLVPLLAGRFRVVTYDRRGHGASSTSERPGRVADDINDLVALIEALEWGPVHLVGHSVGGSISLKTAVDRPDLIRSVVAHEPPLFGLVRDDPRAAVVVADVWSRMEDVVTLIDQGQREMAARQFLDSIILEPGAWAERSRKVQLAITDHADTFAEEVRDPAMYAANPAALAALTTPVLLTFGEASRPWFAPVVTKLAGILPHVTLQGFAGAGHVVMVSHPADYAEAIVNFVLSQETG